jgi:hypothetical protein
MDSQRSQVRRPNMTYRKLRDAILQNPATHGALSQAILDFDVQDLVGAWQNAQVLLLLQELRMKDPAEWAPSEED